MAVKPWERMEGEGPKAFEAFRVYRDMGSERTITAVGRQLSKSRNLIDRWKDRYRWAERVLAYDNDLERAAYQEAVRNVREMQKRHIGMAAQIQHKAMLALQSLNPSTMKPNEQIAFIREATKLEREARTDVVEDYEKKHGSGTSKPQRSGTPDSQGDAAPSGGCEIDLSALSDEELVNFEQLLTKLTSKQET